MKASWRVKAFRLNLLRRLCESNWPCSPDVTVCTNRDPCLDSGIPTMRSADCVDWQLTGCEGMRKMHPIARYQLAEELWLLVGTSVNLGVRHSQRITQNRFVGHQIHIFLACMQWQLSLSLELSSRPLYLSPSLSFLSVSLLFLHI